MSNGSATFIAFNLLFDGPIGGRASRGGSSHTCALISDGSVKIVWGDNYYGQLGDGTTTSSSIPVDVVNLTDAVSYRLQGVYLVAR